MRIIETVQRVTPLGVAFHDLLTDAAITDGLVVSARPSVRTGRFRQAYTSPRGIHHLADIPGLRELEFPRPRPGERAEVDLDVAALPSGPTVDVDVLVEDRLRRFLPTVLQLLAPRAGIATALDALAGCSTLAWSIPDEMPMFLMSSPQRSIPPTTAVVRACLRHHTTLEPAAHAMLVIDTPAGRNLGVADSSGDAVVAFAYPQFTGMAVTSPPEGSHGVPTADQQWPVEVGVRWEPDALSYPAGVPIPRVHSVFCQRPGAVHALDAGPATAAVSFDLRYTTPLVLSTGGISDPSRASYLFVEPAP
jgi:hypothetical protein